MKATMSDCLRCSSAKKNEGTDAHALLDLGIFQCRRRRRFGGGGNRLKPEHSRPTRLGFVARFRLARRFKGHLGIARLRLPAPHDNRCFSLFRMGRGRHRKKGFGGQSRRAGRTRCLQTPSPSQKLFKHHRLIFSKSCKFSWHGAVSERRCCSVVAAWTRPTPRRSKPGSSMPSS